jgi:hypothetical protein
MNTRRSIGLILAVWALVAFVIPTSGIAADEATDPSIYFRPAVRFGTDDRTLFIMDFLIPVYRGNKDLLFINTKFTPDDHDAWETNLGIGYRRLVMDDRLVVGGNLFYDHRKTRYGSHFDQLGLGFEAMAEPGGIGLMTRINYYQPLNRAKLGDDFGYVFYGSGIYTAGIEEPMTGFDYEAGVRIPGISNYVETWAYAGGYHFFGCHVPDVNGFSARLEAMPTDFLRLNFEFRNDSVNHDHYYGEVAFEVPFSIENLVAGKNPFEGIGDVLNGSRSLKERMVEPVRRDVDIVVGTDYLSGLDAATGNGDFMEGVIFVADNAAPGGDGSFENPYSTLELAEADGRLGNTVNTIHVMRGAATGLSGYLFDTPGLVIWGAGATYPKYPYVANLVTGWPLITSTLTMDAPNMILLGLNFELSDTSAIEIGTGAAGAGLSIFSNRIYNEYGGGNAYGILCDISGRIGAPDSPAVISGNTISVDSSDEAAGILLRTSPPIHASIFRNTISNIKGVDVAYGIYMETAVGGITGSISSNTISGVYGGAAACGFRSLVVAGDFAGSISDNTISDIGGDSAYGICASIWVAGITGSISGNTISGINGDVKSYGILGFSENTFVGSISSNTISGINSVSNAYGIYAESWSFDITGSISSNTISGINSVSNAYGICAESGRHITGSITNNDIEVSAGDEAYGLYAESFNGSLGTFSSPLVFTGNSGTINGAVADMAYLRTIHPDTSNVWIGGGRPGMGSNHFFTTGTWSGNYPYSGGPIWADDGGSFINP